MSTYTCYECGGVFSGRGLFPNGGTASSVLNHPHCPGCTLVLEQRHFSKQNYRQPIDNDTDWIRSIFDPNHPNYYRPRW